MEAGTGCGSPAPLRSQESAFWAETTDTRPCGSTSSLDAASWCTSADRLATTDCCTCTGAGRNQYCKSCSATVYHFAEVVLQATGTTASLDLKVAVGRHAQHLGTTPHLKQRGGLHPLCQRLFIQHGVERRLMQAHMTRAAHGVQRHARNRVEQRERLQKGLVNSFNSAMDCPGTWSGHAAALMSRQL
jgi:hypothetical protein